MRAITGRQLLTDLLLHDCASLETQRPELERLMRSFGEGLQTAVDESNTQTKGDLTATLAKGVAGLLDSAGGPHLDPPKLWAGTEAQLSNAGGEVRLRLRWGAHEGDDAFGERVD